MNSKHCTLLTLLLPLALFPILVFASGGEQVCSSQDFFQIIMGTYFFIAIIGLLLTAIMFYPKKFKKKNRELKELKEAHLRFSKLMKSFYYLSISSVFLIIVIVLIVITIFPESSTMFINENKDGPFYFLIAFIIIATILPQAFASIMIRRLVGYKVSNVGGEIGKFLGTEKNALIYFLI